MKLSSELKRKKKNNNDDDDTRMFATQKRKFLFPRTKNNRQVEKKIIFQSIQLTKVNSKYITKQGNIITISGYVSTIFLSFNSFFYYKY